MGASCTTATSLNDCPTRCAMSRLKVGGRSPCKAAWGLAAASAAAPVCACAVWLLLLRLYLRFATSGCALLRMCAIGLLNGLACIAFNGLACMAVNPLYSLARLCRCKPQVQPNSDILDDIELRLTAEL